MSRHYKNEKPIVLEIIITNGSYVGFSCEKYLSKRWMKHKPSKNNDRDKNRTLHQKINEVGNQLN